jgi:SAM-dependent methyltransferase
MAPGYARTPPASTILLIQIDALLASRLTRGTLGADLQLQRDGPDGDPQVRALLRDTVRAIGPQWLDRVDAKEAAPTLAFIQTVFRQALDLLDNPARVCGWSYRDPAIRQAQGQLSRLVARGIDESASQLPALCATLLRPGAFLDVGSGAGWLAIEIARTWPALRVVGIDPWELALTLARENLADSGVADRIELRSQRVEHLKEAATFTLAWLPGPFIVREIADRALVGIHRALAPGGWLIFGLSPPSADPLEEALVNLRTARSGGHSWTPDEAWEYMRAFDFVQIQAFSPAVPIRFVTDWSITNKLASWLDLESSIGTRHWTALHACSGRKASPRLQRRTCSPP